MVSVIRAFQVIFLLWLTILPLIDTHPLFLGSVERFFTTCGYDAFTGTYDLFVGADQQLAGTVQLAFSGDELLVTYGLTTGCTLTEAQIDVVKETTSGPIPGQFGCKTSPTAAVTSFEVSCSLSSFGDIPCCEPFFVYTHAALICDTGEETAYGGNPSCSLAEEGLETGDRKSKWCNVITVDPPCSRNENCSCEEKCICPSVSPTPSVTSSITPSPSTSSTPSITPSSSPSPTSSATPSPSMTSTSTATASPSMSSTSTATASPSMSSTSTATASPSMSSTSTATASPSMSSTSTATASPSMSSTSTATASPSMSSTSTATASPTMTSTATATASPSMSSTSTASASPSMSSTSSATASPSMSSTPSSSITPSPSVTPCVCPNCFICMGFKADGSPNCQSDPSTNDAECNPCEGEGDKFCEEAGLPEAFKCCPNSSLCKKETIPGRLETDQSSLPVSFVCSRNCGNTCDERRGGNTEESNACVLFSPLTLNNDGDADTDDIFNVCPDVSVDTLMVR